MSLLTKLTRFDRIPCSETVRLSLCPVLYWEMTRTEGPAPRIGWRVRSASPVVMTQALPHSQSGTASSLPLSFALGQASLNSETGPCRSTCRQREVGSHYCRCPNPLWAPTPEHTNLDASLGVQGQGSPRASSSVVFRTGRCPELQSHGCPE